MWGARDVSRRLSLREVPVGECGLAAEAAGEVGLKKFGPLGESGPWEATNERTSFYQL
jgi:hypothetical protein